MKYKIGLNIGIYKIISEKDRKNYIYGNKIRIERVFELKCKCGLKKEAIIKKEHYQHTTCSIECTLGYENILNKKYGKRVVIDGPKIYQNKKNQERRWLLECECGTKRWISEYKIKNTLGCEACNRYKIGEFTKNKKANNSKPFGESAKNTLYSSYKRSAKERRFEFNLSKNDFIEITTKDCHYCGISPNKHFPANNQHKYNGSYIYNGIDRKNPKIGYILDNCLPCCENCNYAKSDLSYEEFIQLIKKIYNNLNIKP